LAQHLTLRAWWLSTELRRLREAAGLTIAAVTKRTGINRATLQRNEAGQSVPQPRNLRDLLKLYGVKQAEASLLLDLAAQHDVHGWWQAYRDVLPEDYGTFIGFEAQAESERDYAGPFIPGLLQTEAYAEAVARDTIPGIGDDDVAQRVRVKAERRRVFEAETPLQLHAIIPEGAIRFHVGGAALMREQLRALGDLPASVTLQVVPFVAGAHPGMAGPFQMLQFRHPRAPRAVFVETGAGQLIAEGDVDVARYEGYWGKIVTKALSPEQSAQLVADAARKIR
jgi:Uncharacterized protein conserved in bacteria